jgi:hypothetical protein
MRSLKKQKVFIAFLMLTVAMLGFGVQKAKAGAAILTISSATVTAGNKILVVFTGTSEDYVSCDFSKYHIDVNDGGFEPLTPDSCTVTTNGVSGDGEVELTFAQTPFADTATAFTGLLGLYLEADAVTDGDANTNAVVAHGASIVIADGQKPTFTASRNLLNRIVLTFSENVDASDTATAAWTVAGATVSSVTDPDGGTSLTIITTGLTSTSSTPEVNYVAQAGTVGDVAPVSNEVANGGAVVAADAVVPVILSAVRNSNTQITVTLSEVAHRGQLQRIMLVDLW